MIHPVGTPVKIRRLKKIRLTGGAEGTLEEWLPDKEKYKINFNNGFVGWYDRHDLWIWNEACNDWKLHA